MPQLRAMTSREPGSPFQRVRDAGMGSDRGCLLLPSVGTVAAEDAEEEDVFPAGLPVPLSALHSGSHYLAWVQASNALGVARSAPRRLNLQELGTPVCPSVHLRAAPRAGAMQCHMHHPEMSL